MDPAEMATPLAPASSEDLEAAAVDEPRWASWARQAAERVRQKAAEAAEDAAEKASRIADAVEKAKSGDWSEFNRAQENVSDNISCGFEVVKERTSEVSERVSERVIEHRTDLSRGLSRSFDSVSESASSATALIQERGQAGLDTSRASVESLQLGETFTKAKDSVSAAAGAATGALSHAGGSLSVLTISPTTWAQFAGVFVVGSFFIMMSLNFLPILLIAPHKFAMLFTIGSVTMLSSFVIFNGPKAFLESMSQRDKLPFSVLYGIGLTGTLWATLLMRSFILTAVFSLLQAIALLYFVASYLPGGRATVNWCCGLGGRSVRSIMRT